MRQRWIVVRGTVERLTADYFAWCGLRAGGVHGRTFANGFVDVLSGIDKHRRKWAIALEQFGDVAGRDYGLYGDWLRHTECAYYIGALVAAIACREYDGETYYLSGIYR